MVGAGGGGGGGGRSDADREGPSAFSQMTPAERAAYYAERPIEGSLALGAQDLFGNTTLMGQISKNANPDAFYDSRLEKLGLDPESFAYGPPDPNFSSQAAATARNEALQAAITAANADTGLVANPMSLDPSQRVVSTPVVTAPPVVAPAITEGLLSTPIVETPVEAPVTDLPPNARFYGTGEVPPEISENDFYAAQAAANLPSEIQSLLSRYPAPVEAPVTDLPPNARFYGTGEIPPEISENDFYAAQAAANLPAEIQSLLSRYPAPVVAPAPAPAPVAPATITATETYRGDEPNPAGYVGTRISRDTIRYTRPVTVNVADFTDSQGNFDFSALQRAGLSISGIGGGQGSSGGGYTVGGYAPGSQAAAAAASGTVGGYGPGTPGFNSGMTGLYKGGHVSMQHLNGPNPDGPDDGYVALKMGEYVINDKAVKKYGIELMNAINSGKISKGKLRGLLEM
jgi:hypothetical protein